METLPSLSESIDRTRLALNGCLSADAVFRGVEGLLQACTWSTDVEPQDFRAAAVLIRDLSLTYPNISQIMLTYLPSLAHPVPFIEIIPSLFAISSPEVTSDAVTQLLVVLQADSRLTIPVMAAMTELPLPVHCIQQLAEVAEAAVQSVEGDDLPLLFRTLLKAMEHINASSLSARLRIEISNLPIESAALVLEVLWDSLPNSKKAAEFLLQHIHSESYKDSTLGLFDVAIVMILNCSGGVHLSMARETMKSWLVTGKFPFETLEAIVAMRKTNEVWNRMIPAIWTQCLWVLDVLSHEGVSRGNVISIFVLVLKGLSRLIRQIFLASQFHQEAIVASMLKYVFASNDIFLALGSSPSAFRLSGKHLWKSSQTLPTIDKNSRCYDIELKADISSQILIEITKVCPDVGCQVFNAFLNHLNPDSDGMIELPQIHVLTRIVACIVAAISRSPQIESTLLIIIQKYLSTVFLTSDTQSLMAILISSKKKISCHEIQTAENNIHNNQTGFLVKYPPASVGLILAKHLIHRKLNSSTGDADISALISWICRFLRTSQDSSIYFALDVLIHVLTKGMGNYRQEKEIRRTIVKSINEFVRCTVLLSFKDDVADENPQFRSVLSPDPSAVGNQLEGKAICSYPKVNVWRLSCIADAAVKVFHNKSDIKQLDYHDIFASVSASYWILNYVGTAQKIARQLEDDDEEVYPFHDLFLLSHPEKTWSRSSSLQLRTFPTLRLASKQSRQREGLIDYGLVKMQFETTLDSLERRTDKLSTELWLWSCSSSESFVGRNQSMSKVPDEDLLRLLWERSHLCAVLFGQLRVIETLSADGSGDFDFSLFLSLSKAFCQVSWARHSLRMLDSSEDLSTSKNSFSGHKVSSNHGKDDKFMSKFIQMEGIQQLLNLSCRILPESLISKCLQSLFVAPVLSSTSDANSAEYRRNLNILATDFGLCTIACLAQKFVQSVSSNLNWETKRRNNCLNRLSMYCNFDHFDSINDVFEAAEKVESSSSSKTSPNEYFESSLFAALKCITSYMPGIFQLAREKRFEEAPQNVEIVYPKCVENIADSVSNLQAKLVPFLGASLNRDGCNILLLIFLILVDSSVQNLKQQRSSTDRDGVFTNVYFTEMLENYCKAKSNFHSEDLGPTAEIQTILSVPVSKKLNLDQSFSNKSDGCDCSLAVFFSLIEQEVLRTQNFYVAFAGIRLLTTLADKTLLFPRINALVFTLLQLMFTDKMEFCDSKFNYGADPLTGFLNSFCKTVVNVENMISELSLYPKCRQCLLLLKPYVSSSISISQRVRNSNTFEIFRILWFTLLSQDKTNLYRCLGVIMSDLLATLLISNSSKLSLSSSKKRFRESQTKKIFPHFELEHLDLYYNFVMSTVPSILLMAKPHIPVADESANDHPTPYSSFIHILQTVMLSLKELEKVIDDGEFLPFILKTSSSTIRVCRALLPAVLEAFDCCIHWRSMQPIPERHASDDNSLDSGPTTDWGALNHLEVASDWAMCCANSIGKFGITLKEKIIFPGNLKVSSGTIRSLPVMQNEVASFQTKMLRIAKIQGLSTTRIGRCQLTEVVDSYRKKTELVLRLYKNILDSPVSNALFEPSEGEIFSFHGLSFSKGHASLEIDQRSSMSGLENDVPTSFDLFFTSNREDSGEQSFTTIRSSSASGNTGWGLYSYEDSHEKSDSDSEKSVSEFEVS